MRVTGPLRRKASAPLLRELQRTTPAGPLSVIVKLRREPIEGTRGRTGPSRARALRRSAAQAGSGALAVLKAHKRENPFIHFRASFLLHGLIVSAPLEVIEDLAALEEVVAVEENRQWSVPAPRVGQAG